MFMNPAPDHYVDLFNTPKGKARNEIIYAQYHAVIRDPKALPSEVSAAAARFRQERFIDAGLEGLAGASSCYHLEEIACKLHGPASIMFRGALLMECPRPKQRPRVMLQILAKYHGYRYLVGVRGLTDALKEAGVSTLQRGRFMLERDEFNSRFLPLADAAFMVNEKGGNRNAATDCLRLMMNELLCLADWMELTSQGGRSVLMRTGLSQVLDMIQEYEYAAGRRIQTQKRRKAKGLVST